jgi:hypothetical protein
MQLPRNIVIDNDASGCDDNAGGGGVDDNDAFAMLLPVLATSATAAG